MKAVVFDIDGTLSPEVSWLALTRDLGASVEEHAQIYADYKAGRISVSPLGMPILPCTILTRNNLQGINTVLDPSETAFIFFETAIYFVEALPYHVEAFPHGFAHFINSLALCPLNLVRNCRY